MRRPGVLAMTRPRTSWACSNLFKLPSLSSVDRSDFECEGQPRTVEPFECYDMGLISEGLSL
jgi:hypothetical protein